MGNGPSMCFRPPGLGTAKLIFWGGATQLAPAQSRAGEIMFGFPECVVLHADSFFVGRPLPVLALEDELLSGQTYFVLPVDRLPCQDTALTAAAFASLSPGPRKPMLCGSSGQSNAFAYVKDADGKAVIKVQPEFIINLITVAESERASNVCRVDRVEELCSTPELKKHYAQLVGPRDRPWSPRLETIKERRSNRNKIRLSPGRLSPIRMFRPAGEPPAVDGRPAGMARLLDRCVL